MKKFRMPTAYTILFLLLVLVAAATWIIPAGAYERAGEEDAPVAGTYHEVERQPQGPGDVILASFQGFYDAVDVALFILMVGGFLGCGGPDKLMQALALSGVKDLTIICNDGGLPGGRLLGVQEIIHNGQVKHLIATHIGMNKEVGQMMNAGTMKVTLVPQGSLAEKIRAGGYGLGGVLTPTGVGTIIADGKETLTIEGRQYLLELPLHADFALCRASICDKFGNFSCAKATKNFNHVMAMAADTVILGAEKIVEIGEGDVDTFTTAGVYVNYIVGGEQPWQI